MSLQLVMKLES